MMHRELVEQKKLDIERSAVFARVEFLHALARA